MNRNSHWVRAGRALVLGSALTMAVIGPAAAYVGPGAGLTAIGAIMAVIATLFLALVGFVWYPVKRLLRKRSSIGRSKDRRPAGHALADE